jgi:hypothetical protein
MGRATQKSGPDDEDRRWLALAGLVMLLLMVLGFVALGIVMRVNGYPNSNPFIRWTPLALTLRQHGHWGLVLPLVWVIAAVISSHVGRRFLAEVVASALAILALVIPLLFLYAMANSYTHGLLIHTPATETAAQANREQSLGTSEVQKPLGSSAPFNERAVDEPKKRH